MLGCALLIITFSLTGYAQVFISPLEFVSVPGGTATFICTVLNDNTVNIKWLFDNHPLETLIELTDLTSTTQDNVTNGETHGVLDFLDIDHFDTISISCRAELMSQSVGISMDAMLRVQDLLSAVGSLNAVGTDSTISLTWIAPPTLDITGVDPDISGYCVDVVNSTSSSTLHSECGINVTEFSYPTPPDTACHIYTFTVTPVNVVGNGTADTTSYRGVHTVSEAWSMQRVHTSPEVFSYELNMTAPVCNASIASVMDINTGDNVTNTADWTVIVENHTSVTLSFSQLMANRHFIVSLKTSNVFDSITFSTTISTHDIIHATVAPGANVAIITHYFSNARGALFLFVSTVSDGRKGDFVKSTMMPLSRNSSHNHTLPFSLSAGQYKVSVYDIEQDGTLSSGVSYPAISDQFITISGTSRGPEVQPTASENCNVTTFADLIISAMCTHSSNSMATGYQMIVQFVGALDKLYVSRTMDGQTSASVEVEESGQYLVSIIPIIEGTGITDSTVEYVEKVIVDVIQPGNNTTIATEEDVLDTTAKILFSVLGCAFAVFVFACLLVARKFWIKYTREESLPQYNDTPGEINLTQSTIGSQEQRGSLKQKIRCIFKRAPLWQ